MKRVHRISAIVALTFSGVVGAAGSVGATTISGSCASGFTCMWEGAASGNQVIETDGALANFTAWHFLDGNVLNDNDVTNQNFTSGTKYLCKNINFTGGISKVLNVGATVVFSPASSADGSSLNNNTGIPNPCS